MNKVVTDWTAAKTRVEQKKDVLDQFQKKPDDSERKMAKVEAQQKDNIKARVEFALELEVYRSRKR
jgi:hypothetical protein